MDGTDIDQLPDFVFFTEIRNISRSVHIHSPQTGIRRRDGDQGGAVNQHRGFIESSLTPEPWP